MSRTLYELKNGELTITDINDDEAFTKGSDASSYLFVSSLFDDVTPVGMKDKRIIFVDSFLSSYSNLHYEDYCKLINTLMKKILTAKSINDLTNTEDSRSFYSILTRYYRAYSKTHEKYKINNVYDNDEDYIATLSRMVIRYYVNNYFNNLKDFKNLKTGTALSNLRIGGKSINKIEDNRLDEDEKLTDYINLLYNKKKNTLSMDTNGHLCKDCKIKKVTDCPKLEHMIDGLTFEDEYLREFIEDGEQLVTLKTDEQGNEKKETEYCVVRSCKLYRYADKVYRQEKEEKDAARRDELNRIKLKGKLYTTNTKSNNGKK